MLSQSKDQYKSWTEWSSSQVCTHVFEGKEKGLMDWGSTLEQGLSKVNEKKAFLPSKGIWLDQVFSWRRKMLLS